MPGKSNPERHFDFSSPRFTQISESHCGPAVIQMLLSNLGLEVSQEAIAEAGGATRLIELNGMRVDQLARAVRLLAPQAQFWYKDHASLDDLTRLVVDYRYPVGVEWQGLFEDREEDETDEGDYGHYSVVIIIDEKNRQVVIADPYKDFRSQDRVFPLDWFYKRWYDVNEVEDEATERVRLVEDRQMLFIITPADEHFPRELGMRNNL